MKNILNIKIVRVGFITLSIALISIVTGITLTNPTTSASASPESIPCSSSGEVTNAPDETSIIFTVTLNGLCKDAPLVLTSIDPSGAEKVLAILPLTSNSDGTKTVSVSFTPKKSVASYVVNVAEAFSATVTP